jgi:hypothetical protein
MKKYLMVVMFLAAAHYGFGQGFYVKVGAGYAFPMGSQGLFEETDAREIVGNASVVTSKTTVVKGSYGAGINFNAAAGYKFSPFIGIDLNVSYLVGKEFSANSTIETGNGSVFEIGESTKSKGFFFSPALMFMAGTENIRPYGLVGVIAGSMKVDDETILFTDNTDTQATYVVKTEVKGDFAFGFRGGVGVDFNISDRISIYAEGIFNSIAYYPKSSEVVTADVDGDDALSDLTVSQRETVYVDEVTTTSINGVIQTDQDEPTQELRSPRPLSSVGLNVGLKIKLGSD